MTATERRLKRKNRKLKEYIVALKKRIAVLDLATWQINSDLKESKQMLNKFKVMTAEDFKKWQDKNK